MIQILAENSSLSEERRNRVDIKQFQFAFHVPKFLYTLKIICGTTWVPSVEGNILFSVKETCYDQLLQLGYNKLLTVYFY